MQCLQARAPRWSGLSLMSLPPSIRWPGAQLCRGHPNPTPGLFSATSWSSPPTGSRARLVSDRYVPGHRCVCETVWLLVPSCHSFIHSSIHPSIYPPILPSFHPSIHPSAQKVFTYQGIRYKCYDRWRINTIPVLRELTACTSGSQPWPGELLKHTKILGSF